MLVACIRENILRHPSAKWLAYAHILPCLLPFLERSGAIWSLPDTLRCHTVTVHVNRVAIAMLAHHEQSRFVRMR
jgi:hypothetical protein